MRLKPVLISLILFFSSSISAQVLKSQIEINSSLQWDSYPSFTTQFNSVTNSIIKLKSVSWGGGINYKMYFKKRTYIKIGLGYFKNKFNKIQNYTDPFGSTESRSIKYTGGSSTFGYVTNKYWYNTVAATIGFEKLFEFKKKIGLTAGMDMVNYYTFSQRYNIPATNSDTRFKRSTGRYFGFSFNANVSLQKEIGKCKIGPNISVPIFKLWKQDEVFPGEQNDRSRTKWLRGIGIGFTCAYPLTKK